jgi:hypothetical protein
VGTPTLAGDVGQKTSGGFSFLWLKQGEDGRKRPFDPAELSQEEQGAARYRSGDRLWAGTLGAEAFEEEVIPSSNMRKKFTQLQERQLLTLEGGASAISRPASQPKDGTASKKHHTT